MSMRLALIGANGQLAWDLMRVLAGDFPNTEIIPMTHSDIEVADRGSVQRCLEAIVPSHIINTSAYHKVDEVEENPDRAFAVNAIGPRNIALVATSIGAVLVHMSTDYVFSGRQTVPYVETDSVDAINVYGASKAAGEMLVRSLVSHHFIVRSSGLYGLAGPSGKGSNFVELMLRLASENRPIRVVNDQTLTPTATYFLALQISALLRTDAYGTYHATCQGQCTWYEFAQEIFRQSGVSPSLSPQTTRESGAKAARPFYSVLENARLKSINLDRMPTWQEALTEYLASRKTTPSVTR